MRVIVEIVSCRAPGMGNTTRWSRLILDGGSGKSMFTEVRTGRLFVVVLECGIDLTMALRGTSWLVTHHANATTASMSMYAVVTGNELAATP